MLEKKVERTSKQFKKAVPRASELRIVKDFSIELPVDNVTPKI